MKDPNPAVMIQVISAAIDIRTPPSATWLVCLGMA
jgi:hypothetical protein